MKGNPSKFKGNDLPVDSVIWDECVEFCNKLSKLDGKDYRLATEAEWEYACRAGSQSAYYYGDDPNLLGSYAWFFGNSQKKPHAVGQKKANDWGLFDMHGNVWQWCEDWYDYDYYGNSPPDNPVNTKAGTGRVVRGGSRNHDAWAAALRSASTLRPTTAPSASVSGLCCRVPKDSATESARFQSLIPRRRRQTISRGMCPAGTMRNRRLP